MFKRESDVAAYLQQSGITVHRPGWPDLLLELPTGEIIALELKAATDTVKRHQSICHEVLRRAGIPVLVLTYEGALARDWGKVRIWSTQTHDDVSTLLKGGKLALN